MDHILADILSIPECRCLKIVAGENGLKRKVNWTAAIEVIEIIRFSNEGDLNFVTGLAIASDNDFLSIVMEADQYKMAGIVFALGPYLKEIPQRVLEYGNLHDFPILTMPWEVKISTLSHTIGEFLSAEGKQNQIPIELLKSILLGRRDFQLTPEVKTQLQQYGFSERCRYQVLFIRIVPKRKDAEERSEEIQEYVRKSISRLYFGDAVMIPIDFGIAVLLRYQGPKKDLDEKELNEIRNLIIKLQVLFDDYEMIIGIGKLYQELEQIADSYAEAELVTKLFSAEIQRRKEVYRYEQLGEYKLIWNSGNAEEMKGFSEEILGPLKAYDEINGTDFMKFLRAYFEYNGNIKEISEHLFLHKNTALYRLRKLEGILGCSFTRLETLFQIKLALMIHEIASDGFNPSKP